MSHKQLNLEEIQEEILDECFSDEDKTIESLVKNADDEFIEVQTDTSEISLTMDKIKESVKETGTYVSNEVLVRKVQFSNDDEEVKRSKELLIMYNSGLVYTEAKNCTCNIPFNDKVQYGFEGLMKAIYGFNTNFKTQFSTYATTAIRQHMYRNGNNDVRIVALPEHLSVYNNRVQAFIAKSVSEGVANPTPEMVAVGTGIDIRSVKRIMNYNSSTFSFDTPMNRGGDEGSQQTLQDIIPGESSDYIVDERCVSKDFLSSMEEVGKHLTNSEMALVGMIYGCYGYATHTFDEIIDLGFSDNNGNLVNSKATLSRRHEDVMKKVRRIVERFDIDFDS